MDTFEFLAYLVLAAFGILLVIQRQEVAKQVLKSQKKYINASGNSKNAANFALLIGASITIGSLYSMIKILVG